MAELIALESLDRLDIGSAFSIAEREDDPDDSNSCRGVIVAEITQEQYIEVCKASDPLFEKARPFYVQNRKGRFFYYAQVD